MPPKKKVLFDDAAEAAGETSASTRLTTNAKFAEKYESKKRKQDLARARELGFDPANDAAADSSTDESEDDGAALTADLDARVRATIDMIRKKDPRVYDSKVAFFSEKDEAEPEGTDAPVPDDAEESSAPMPKKAKKAKKLTGKDVLREQLLDAVARGAEDAFEQDEEDLEDAAARRRRLAEESRPARAYDAEQEALRRAFLETVNQDAALVTKSADDDSGAGGDDGLLRARPKKKKKSKKAAAAGEREDGDESGGDEVTREELKRHLLAKDGKGIAAHAGELGDPEAFLAAFMRTRAWRDDEDEAPMTGWGRVGAASAAEDDGEDGAESDVDAVEAADAFEAKYNFRFEQEGSSQILTHARRPEDSLRRKDTSRQDERVRRRERKDAEKAAAAAEVRRLMNLKRAEAKSRLQQVRAVAGNGVDMSRLAAVLGDELDADFDPATYDAKMAALFGAEYDDAPELDAPAPVLVKGAGGGGAKARSAGAAPDAGATDDEGEGEGDDDEDLPAGAAWVFGDGPRPAWAGPSAEELAEGADDGLGEAGPPADALEEDAEDDDGDNDDPAVVGRRRDRGRRQRQRRHLSDVARVRAELEASAAAAGGVDDSDDVLALGFEDVIAGGLRTRFAYTAVPPDDFGLGVDELLAAEDADLNRYVGLRKLAPYRETPWVVPPKRRRRAVAEIRKRLLVSAPQRPVDAAGSAESSGAAAEEDGSDEPVALAASAPQVDADDADEAVPADASDKKKKRRREDRGGESGARGHRRGKGDAKAGEHGTKKRNASSGAPEGTTAAGVKLSRLASYNFA